MDLLLSTELAYNLNHGLSQMNKKETPWIS